MDNNQNQAAQPPVTSPPPVVPPPPVAPKPSRIKIPLVIAVIIFFLIVGGSIFAILSMEGRAASVPRDTNTTLSKEKPQQTEPCPTDTKKCSNGITVPRLAPKCDFAPCSGEGAPVATPTTSTATPTPTPNIP